MKICIVPNSKVIKVVKKQYDSFGTKSGDFYEFPATTITLTEYHLFGLIKSTRQYYPNGRVWTRHNDYTLWIPKAAVYTDETGEDLNCDICEKIQSYITSQLNVGNITYTE